MPENRPSPLNEHVDEQLRSLYMRRSAIDRLIRSLQIYRRSVFHATWAMKPQGTRQTVFTSAMNNRHP